MFGIQQAEGLDQSSRGSDFFFLIFYSWWDGRGPLEGSALRSNGSDYPLKGSLWLLCFEQMAGRQVRMAGKSYEHFATIQRTDDGGLRWKVTRSLWITCDNQRPAQPMARASV